MRRDVLLFAGTAMMLAVAGCKRSEGESVAAAPSRSPQAVATTTAVRQDVASVVSASGTVMPWQELTLGSQTSGLTILDVAVKENDTVRGGDVLIRFDDRAIRAQVAGQKASVVEAKANLETARRAAVRGESLLVTKAMSQEEVETRRTTILTDQAKLDVALASLDQLQVQLDQTVLRAPTSGTVSTDPVKIGTTPQAGTELVRIVRDGILEIQVKVPEREIGAIRPGQLAQVTGADGSISQATVRDIAPKLDPVTRLAIAYVRLPAGSPLKPGMFATVAITAAVRQSVVVPEGALVWLNGKPSAFVVEGTGQAKLRTLSISSRQDSRAAVAAGIEAGERVVTAGAGFLRDGDRVRVEPALASTNAKVLLR